MNRDKLNALHCHAATTAAFAALDGIQHMSPEQQLAGVAMLFIEMCEGTGVDPSAAINQAQRRAKDDNTFAQCEVRALRAYVQGEMTK